jgi:hypothetical protein
MRWLGLSKENDKYVYFLGEIEEIKKKIEELSQLLDTNVLAVQKKITGSVPEHGDLSTGYGKATHLSMRKRTLSTKRATETEFSPNIWKSLEAKLRE